jgi:hypothetical protein
LSDFDNAQHPLRELENFVKYATFGSGKIGNALEPTPSHVRKSKSLSQNYRGLTMKTEYVGLLGNWPQQALPQQLQDRLTL